MYSDIYALGMTFYELLHGEYYDYNLDATLQDFSERYCDYHKQIIGSLGVKNDLLSKLITKMICINPTERIPIKDVLNVLRLIQNSPEQHMLLDCSNSDIYNQFQCS